MITTKAVRKMVAASILSYNAAHEECFVQLDPQVVY